MGAASAILMNADTGALLFEKHAHVPSYPASITKIGTTLYILDQEVQLDQVCVVSTESLKRRPSTDWEKYPPYWLDKDGTTMGLKIGEALTVEALLHGLLMVSGNDAANVLAENIGSGSVPQFIERVNEYLRKIGCKNTQFSNPHGLTHPDHWTTAYDVALMTRRALQIPTFRTIIGTVTFCPPQTNKQPERELVTTNPFVKPGSRYYYPKAIGGKTGYTAAAQHTCVTIAEHEGRALIAVVLGCKDRLMRYEDTKKLLDTAFAEEKVSRRLMGPETTLKKRVLGAKSEVKVSLVKPLSIAYFPSEEPKCKAVLHWNISELPIRKGQKVGEVHILTDDGRFLEKGDLIAREEVKGRLFFTLRKWLFNLFK
ncbi:MAG: hypothetical protein A3I67_00335 [Chlamydiae bacterium RIFCSPLOWO2_02_FULL_45_22]|nr:MAG: hypothetical protein A3I67_00335 [Chlamydiae bacterium RIFCSPLOWO2_02_FULL_45_22]